MEPNLRPGEDMEHFLERQAGEMQERANRLQEAFASAGATVTSGDGSVTVTLAPNGGLRNLRLGKRACELGSARLTSLIMETVAQAQRQTAQAVTGSVESIIGGGETLEMMKSFLPPDPVAEMDAVQEKFAPEAEAEQTPPRPARPGTSPPASRPRPRRRPAPDNADEDEVNPW